jgi:hypothetical protein
MFLMDAVIVVFAVIYFLVVFMLLGAMLAATFGFVIVSYVLEGKALSAIARRRGIEKPWLAWVPVGSSWLLGAISDQYRYVVHGQIRNRRKLLTWLSAALYAAMTVLFTALGIWMVVSIAAGITADEETFMATYMGGFFLMYLVLFAFYGVAAVASVFQYMAIYDLFRSCDPGKSLMYLLVSIFASFPLPFFLYSCRNKDLGMPPKAETPQLPCE